MLKASEERDRISSNMDHVFSISFFYNSPLLYCIMYCNVISYLVSPPCTSELVSCTWALIMTSQSVNTCPEQAHKYRCVRVAWGRTCLITKSRVLRNEYEYALLSVLSSSSLRNITTMSLDRCVSPPVSGLCSNLSWWKMLDFKL